MSDSMNAHIAAALKDLAPFEVMRAQLAFEIDVLLPEAVARGLDVSTIVETIGPEVMAAGVLSYGLAYRAAELHPGMNVETEAAETLSGLLPQVVSAEEAEALGWR
ncbi:hypothetical protein ADK91_03050 [Streptomyces sp. XY511]|uniref:hypothetical protein n=1 Tax=Streptomyces sp. XY511 TaxID=1519480 RepID=UPI0006AED546|nr:hypothetical protein [Streptomyces sp. XY511]KOV17167.1 hypothetical protein ADK91_03050 [Streptomyces sp. XY511]